VARIGCDADQILFLSDIAQELDAARQAGMHTRLVARAEPPLTATHELVTRFDDISL
jgi:enolase-phosphatase E1